MNKLHAKVRKLVYRLVFLKKRRFANDIKRIYSFYSRVRPNISNSKQSLTRKHLSPMNTTLNRPVRVLVAKVGLDGHDRGAKVIATSLRDAGMEVIYTGLRQTPEMVVNAALQEDVDAIGISILSGAHMTVFPKIMELLKERKLDNILVTGGGIIPPDDMKTLRDMGIGQLFAPGATMGDIAKYIQTWTEENRNY